MLIYGHVSAYPAWSVRKSGRPQVSAIFDLLILFLQRGFFFFLLLQCFFLLFWPMCFWPGATFWWQQLLRRRCCNCCNFLCVSSANALNFDVGQMLSVAFLLFLLVQVYVPKAAVVLILIDFFVSLLKLAVKSLNF